MKRVERITIDEGLCKACGICVELCPRHVFDAGRLGRPTAERLSECTACRFCEYHCPDFAIRVVVASAAAPLAAGEEA